MNSAPRAMEKYYFEKLIAIQDFLDFKVDTKLGKTPNALTSNGCLRFSTFPSLFHLYKPDPVACSDMMVNSMLSEPMQPVMPNDFKISIIAFSKF